MANIKISELNPLLTVQDADVLPIVDNGVTKKVTAAILQSYTQGNSVLLTGAQTIAGIKTFTSQLASSVATGTAPFSVASTTKVTNLNADLLDGLSSADFQAPLSGTGIVKSTAGTISYLTDNSTNWNTAYNDKINSAAVTGSGTNTLTLTQQDAGTITATWVNGTLIREVRNSTGATLTKGTIVYISGATGNKPTVSKAIATGDSTSAQTFGFIQTDIANNANGYVVVVGDLTGLDTSAFTEGDQLYLSSTTAGTFTSTKQYAPAHLVYVGIVTRSHPTLGQIEVNIQNGYEMDELHNVSAQNPSNGDILQFVTSTGLWTKVAGTTSNISEGTNLYFTNARSRSAISLTTTGTSGAATYNSTTGVLNVPNYADTDTGITSLNGLTALTQTFAVGTSGTDFGISSASSTHTFNLPTASATNRGALSSADWTTFNNKQNALTNPITGTGTTNYLPKFTGSSALGDSQIFDNGSGVTINGTTVGEKFNVNGYIGLQNAGVQKWHFGVNASNALVFSRSGIADRMVLDSDGQLLLGTTTSGSYLLDVNGTARVSGAATFSSSVTANGTLTVNEDGASTKIITIRSNWAGVDPAINVTTNNSLLLMTNNTERMRITAAGNVTTVLDATINGVTVGKGAGNVADNTAVGKLALNSNTSGADNTAFGSQTLFSNTTGSSNIGLGTYPLYANTSGSNNVGVGHATLYINSSGSNNTAIGNNALFLNTASNNTAIGFESAYNNTSGAGITAIGYLALRANTTGADNTAIGFSALKANTTGTANISLGGFSLFSNTTGSNNSAFGLNALFLNTTGSNNTAIGNNALFLNTASGNTAVGFEAAYSNTSAISNTAIGYQALRANTTTGQSTAVGYLALLANTAANNTCMGAFSGYKNTTGELNVFLGTNAGGDAGSTFQTTGNSNTVIGVDTATNNYSGCTILGRNAAATANNQFVVGSASVNAGAVATEVNASSKVWNVIINGVAQKILLA